MKKVTITPVIAVMTPYALARMSRHMFLAGRDYQTTEEKPLIKFYLFCASVELGLKAAILATDCTKKKKEFLRSKIGHDLVRALSEFSKLYETKFINDRDQTIIKKINPYFKGKGLEYFTTEMLLAALTGFKSLPDVGDLEKVAHKIQDFLEHRKYFIDGKTSDSPGKGIMNFV